MLLAISFVLFVFLALSLFAFGAAYFAPASVFAERLRAVVGISPKAKAAISINDRLEQVLGPISSVLPKSPNEVSRTRALLMQAGYREDRHATIYFGLRGLFAIAGLAFTVVSGLALRSPLLLITIPAFGYFLPRFVLKRRIKSRQDTIRLALPDALDLTVICVEAGLGLDQALLRVGRDLQHVHRQLSDELTLVHLEMRAGKPRSEALRNLALRTGVDDLKALVAILVQTDRFGTSVSQALRVHSDALRVERRQRAEEQAAKTNIKMVPVLVFFIFPSMFFISLGPALIQLYRVLLPAINK